MSNRKYKWPEDVKVDCDPENDCNRRYILKIFPKDEAIIENKILVIMCNPSTADKYWSDPTCNKLIRLCKSNGYNSITICNLFTFRGQVKELDEFIENGTANDNSNDEKLKEQIEKFNKILCAWGGPYKEIKNKKILNDRIKEVFKILKPQKLRGKKILKLKTKKESENKYPQYPPHPLYKKHNTEFEPYCMEKINIEE